MNHQALLGLPLPLALERLAAEGVTPVVRLTNPPGRENHGAPRVIAVRKDGRELIVSAFEVSL